jgi:hypothetical protein
MSEHTRQNAAGGEHEAAQSAGTAGAAGAERALPDLEAPDADADEAVTGGRIVNLRANASMITSSIVS